MTEMITWMVWAMPIFVLEPISDIRFRIREPDSLQPMISWMPNFKVKQDHSNAWNAPKEYIGLLPVNLSQGRLFVSCLSREIACARFLVQKADVHGRSNTTIPSYTILYLGFWPSRMAMLASLQWGKHGLDWQRKKTSSSQQLRWCWNSQF